MTTKSYQAIIKLEAIVLKLNLDKNLLDLSGNPIEGKMSDVLANMLAMSTEGEPARVMAWAVNLINNGEIDIEKKDKEFLISSVKRSRNVINLAKAQIIEEIEKLSEQE